MARSGFARATATLRRARDVGPRGVAQRLAARVYRATDARALDLHLDPADVVGDVPASLPVPAPRPARGAGPDSPGLTVGWVTSPPAAGSGGHTTLFRMVEGLEARGHRCVVYLYDRYGLDIAQRTAELRRGWPGVRAEVRDARAGISGVDAVVASSWESAHVVLSYGAEPVHRLYFIQDYEPYFYPRGSEYELAAMTYRFPFRRIALGEMVAGCLRSELGQDSDLVPFGCDTRTYHLPKVRMPRSGVVLYAKPDVGRRGYLLARLALERFHRTHPDQEIHVYGSQPTGLPFPVTYHGSVTPAALNELYGRVVAGLAMSFTNISLVAEEMLAAGVVPIVNDSPLSRADLPNAHVGWAEPTAEGIAVELAVAVDRPDVDAYAATVAESVMGRSWDLTQELVAQIVEDEVRRGDGA
ncbi:glycosyltransferase family 1 protein [Promicromonospora sp. NPDC023805]|uniref:rhamnosyltransferase WsaF family glycosyltransferase n=1 Tax=Promicromonospora sp. NPDC023805 TaxID=3154696 RepID=UPI0033DF409F